MLQTIDKRFNKFGVKIPEILLPAKGIDLSKWSVVACDQYTSQPEYWEGAEKLVGDNPSTLKLIFPEAFLEAPDEEEKIKKINKTMEDYLKDHTLTSQAPGFIYVDRSTTHASSRKGLIIAVDLEAYDYGRESQTLIRATEGTVIERLPPRIRIRKNASIELPHIMLLIDDPEKTVIEPVAKKASQLQLLYDFELMMEGKHIKGYKVDDAGLLSDIADALEKLADPSKFYSRSDMDKSKGLLLFAVGDGNHSLATAKACWDLIKKDLSPSETETHPARYALVELINVHDDGLVFEPIHRILFNVKPEEFLSKMVSYYNSSSKGAFYKVFDSKTEMDNDLNGKASLQNAAHIINFIFKDTFGYISVPEPQCNLEVGTLQICLDYLKKEDTNLRIDYIHGDDVVHSLGSQEGNIGFFLPTLDKHDLFKTVIKDGALPRKTFSMGEAEEKRFYLECRKIR